MNCFSCRFPFSPSRIPRVLILCGHTICESCLTLHHSNNSICCPECKLINHAPLHSFPKNLPLLSLSPTTTTTTTTPLLSCPSHNKPYEAFCDRDKQLLCVTCLLEPPHKTHKIMSIEQTVAQDKEILEAASKEIKATIEDLHRTSERMKEAKESVGEKYQKEVKEMEKFYGGVRRFLEDREREATERMEEWREKEEAKVQRTREEL